MHMPNDIYQFYTYIYYDPDTLQPFLVGKGFGKRYKFHLACSLKESHNPHKFYKIRKIHNSGKKPIIKLLYKETEDEAYELEDFLSHYWELERFGGLLVNLKYGGRGGMANIPKSDEHKKHLRESAKHRPPVTEDARKNRVDAQSQNWQITYPNGETKIIKNLTQFCRDNNLYQGNMVCVSQGKRKHHKGFKCSKVVLQ
jgi:hypothetical protein